MNNTLLPARAKQASGFTLLEIVIVLGLIGIFVTWFTISISTVKTEDKLRAAAGDVGVLAKRARSIAVQQQRPYQLTISEESLSIGPLYASADDSSIILDEEEEQSGFEDITDTEETDPEITYEIKGWRSDDWIVIENDRKFILTLDPNGLVEPISIRCSLGDSWLIQELHPLTASVRDEEMSIENE